jgi:hypothetical protein
MLITFWVGILKERRHLEDPKIDADNTESKVVLVHVMRSYGGLEVEIYSFLTTALDVGKWLSSRSGPLYPQGKKDIGIN